MRGFLFAVACLLQSTSSRVRRRQEFRFAGSVVSALGFQRVGSVVVARGLSCPAACGIFPDQGWNHAPCAGRHRFLTAGPPGKSEVHFKDRGDRSSNVDAASESKGKIQNDVWVFR